MSSSIVSTPSLPAIKECDFCHTQKPDLLVCGKCLLVRYCDQNCQRGAWKVHKLVCQKPAPEPVTQEAPKASAGIRTLFHAKLPMDQSNSITLVVGVPYNFKLSDSYNYSSHKSLRAVFIPIEDTDQNFTEALRLQKLPLDLFSTRHMTCGLIKFHSRGKEVVVLNKEHKSDILPQTFFLLKLKSKEVEEICAGKYFAGPVDYTGLTYTVRLNGHLTEGLALEKLRTFFKGNLHLSMS